MYNVVFSLVPMIITYSIIAVTCMLQCIIIVIDILYHTHSHSYSYSYLTSSTLLIFFFKYIAVFNFLLDLLNHHPLTLHSSLSIPSTRNVLGKNIPAEDSFYRSMGSSATLDDDGLPGSIRYNPNSQTNSGTEREWERERYVLTAARTASQSLSQWDQHIPQSHHTHHPQHSNSVQRPISHTLLSQRQGTAGCMEDYLSGVIALAARNVMNDFALLNEKVNHCGDIVLPR